jgi:hypothetical protein
MLVLIKITAEIPVRVVREFGVTSLIPTGNGTGTTANHYR